MNRAELKSEVAKIIELAPDQFDLVYLPEGRRVNIVSPHSKVKNR